MAFISLRNLLVAAALFARLQAQCLNEVAAKFPNQRTMAAEIAVLVVEVPKAAVLDQINSAYLLSSKPKLLPLPKSLNVADDKHLVYVTTGLDTDIRQSVLAIDGNLRQASVFVPYCGIDGSSTPLSAPLITYIAGTGASPLDGITGFVPGLVATAFGIYTAIGSFIPKDKPYEQAGQLFSSSVDAVDVPNPVSGPGIYPSAFDVLFGAEDNPKYSKSDLLKLINLPYILNEPVLATAFPPFGKAKCERNTYFTNYATANAQNISGSVTFGEAVNQIGNLFPSALQQASPEGKYEGAVGIRGCFQLVGYNPFGYEECEAAAKSVDPAALS